MTGTLRCHTGPHTTIEAPPTGQTIQLHGMGKPCTSTRLLHLPACSSWRLVLLLVKASAQHERAELIDVDRADQRCEALALNKSCYQTRG